MGITELKTKITRILKKNGYKKREVHGTSVRGYHTWGAGFDYDQVTKSSPVYLVWYCHHLKDPLEGKIEIKEQIDKLYAVLVANNLGDYIEIKDSKVMLKPLH